MDEKSKCGCKKGMVPGKDGKCLMPEVTFETFVMSLNTSVLYHLGEIADPVTGKRERNLDLARHGIDTLTMIEKKTEGNLSEDEAKMLKDLLCDAKLKFVNAAKA
ncbi:MAG: hypothetical protein CSB24_01565 [Deltaproteobacteria bacterium]|nr:MAG: hypothetical protein CSB24_01565 [Deltaproteobacteria bacterium]